MRALHVGLWVTSSVVAWSSLQLLRSRAATKLTAWRSSSLPAAGGKLSCRTLSILPKSIVLAIRTSTAVLPPLVLALVMKGLGWALHHTISNFQFPLPKYPLNTLHSFWLGPKPPDPSPDNAVVVIYVHGGGFVFNDGMQFPIAAALHSRFAGTPHQLHFLALEYLDDIGAAVKRIKDTFVDISATHKHVVFMGDSAGGNLVLSAALQGGVSPTCVVAISPWVNLRNDDTASHQENSSHDIISNKFLAAGRNLYSPTLTPETSPALHSPATLATLPPTLLLSGSLELFRDSIENFYQRARAAGASDVRLRVTTDGVHVHQCLPAFADTEGLDAIAEFITHHLID